MDLREQLDRVRAARGALTPQAVVDEARPPEHELHPRFEWNNQVAGEAYRRVQAQTLIQSVRQPITDNTDGSTHDVRTFLSVSRPDNSQPEYVPVEEVAVDPFMRQLVLRQYQRDLATLKARYGHLAEYMDTLRSHLEAG